MLRPRLRIAVLECDEPVGKTKERYGGYGGLFKELLENGATQLAEQTGEKRAELEISKFDVVNKDVYPNLEDVDGILLTGSKHNSFDNEPWILTLVEFTKKVLAQDRVRLIGVCFGHQIIGRAIGVKVDRSDKGWEVAVVDVDLTPKGKELFGLEKLHIHQMHRDIVYEYPDNVERLGSSPLCDVQGMYIKNHLIAVQGHPEFNEAIETELLERRHAQGIFADAAFNEAMKRVSRPHDGVVVAATFIQFLLEK